MQAEGMTPAHVQATTDWLIIQSVFIISIFCPLLTTLLLILTQKSGQRLCTGWDVEDLTGVKVS